MRLSKFYVLECLLLSVLLVNNRYVRANNITDLKIKADLDFIGVGEHGFLSCLWGLA